jgi:hypothetical protein
VTVYDAVVESAPPSIFTDKRFNFYNLPSKSRVLLVSNVPEVMAKPLCLYRLMQIYGDVERVKVLLSPIHAALVEFVTATGAMIARDHLDGVGVDQHKLVVSFSKFDRVRTSEGILSQISWL